MDDSHDIWIKGSELGSTITQPMLITPKLRGLSGARTKHYRRETKEEIQARQSRGIGGGSTADWMINPATVQDLLDSGRLTLKPEPPEGSSLPSPNAFLAKHGLKRPQ